MLKRKICNWLMILSTVLVTNLSYSQEMTPELFFAKKKLQKAAIAYTAAMETCFEHTPRVRPSELETDKLETELVVEAVNYLHYVALNHCMKDEYIRFLSAVNYYNSLVNRDEWLEVDSFVISALEEEVRGEFEFKQLPEAVQQHFFAAGYTKNAI
ncbi:hypothetical protein SIO17_05080 [Pseudoalteromonas piscicida]|uniref:Orphan protein n=1 Tax=Pseudoalteromonas piscicida TaxID=43662 RepID=A0ABN5CBY1_PSEO7|nr:hypothetical protein [Pseudoalteromonas piscicida]ATD06380.1 hypothetical protein PPIS_a1220 [Pseudoalteromonas piscicida]WPU33105.1 hypothetical protein SIO17_05080 [Pseudoalteromonas piscicida]